MKHAFDPSFSFQKPPWIFSLDRSTRVSSFPNTPACRADLRGMWNVTSDVRGGEGSRVTAGNKDPGGGTSTNDFHKQPKNVLGPSRKKVVPIGSTMNVSYQQIGRMLHSQRKRERGKRWDQSRTSSEGELTSQTEKRSLGERIGQWTRKLQGEPY